MHLLKVSNDRCINLQGAPPMVFYDFTIPLVYGMAFLAIAFDKVTSLRSLMMLLAIVETVFT